MMLPHLVVLVQTLYSLRQTIIHHRSLFDLADKPGIFIKHWQPVQPKDIVVRSRQLALRLAAG